MKKAISIFVALVITFSLYACNTQKTVEDACNEANMLLKEWNDEAAAGCWYSGEYEELYGTCYYTVDAHYLSAVVYDSDYPELVLTLMTQDIYSNLYPQLCDVFDGLYVSVMIVLGDENENNAFSIIEGDEITYLD